MSKCVGLSKNFQVHFNITHNFTLATAQKSRKWSTGNILKMLSCYIKNIVFKFICRNMKNYQYGHLSVNVDVLCIQMSYICLL